MILAFLLTSMQMHFVENARAVAPEAQELSTDQVLNKYIAEKNLAVLQRDFPEGVASPQPWAGYWWPYGEGGVNNTKYYRKGKSPAEAADLALGQSDWISGWEHANHGLGLSDAYHWWGHCNGWAASSVMEREPRESVWVSGVEFSVGQRKALLAELWMESVSDFVGERVTNWDDFESPDFWDVTPAQFYLLLTNVMGRQRQSIIVDKSTGIEVWNHPLVAYETRPISRDDYLGADPKSPSIYRVAMETTLWWPRAIGMPGFVTPRFRWQSNYFFSKRTLRYELWVDAPLEFNESGQLVSSGQVILEDKKSGRWMNGSTRDALVNSHPDFMWIPVRPAKSTGRKNPRLDDKWVLDNIR